MKREQIIKLCITGTFTALICMATMVIQIPAPIAGVLNLGDCFVLIAAWILGPWYGFAAGGIGSALADLFTGYTQYIPATLIIKGLMAVAAALIVRAFLKKGEKLRFAGFIVSGIVAEVIMVVGYYLFESAILRLGWIPALVNIPPNCVQGAFGLVLSVILIRVIIKTGLLKKLHVYVD